MGPQAHFNGSFKASLKGALKGGDIGPYWGSALQATLGFDVVPWTSHGSLFGGS